MAEEGDVEEASKWGVVKAKWRCLQAPENQDKWKMVTDATLQDARSLTRDMWKQLSDQQTVEVGNPAPLSTVTGRSMKQGGSKPRPMDSSLAQSVVSLNAGPKAVISFHVSCDENRRWDTALHQKIEQVRECHTRVSHAQRAKWGPTKTNEWRLELRTKRPQSEQFEDHLQQALTKESEMLKTAREQLGGLAAEVALMKENLESVRQRVNRRQTNNLLPANSLCKHKDWEGWKLNAPPASAAPPAAEAAAAASEAPPPQEPAAEGEAAEAAPLPMSPKKAAPERVENQEEVVKLAKQLIKDAEVLTKKADAAVEKFNQDCQAATSRVTASLAKRTVETRAIQAKLETQLDEMEQAITAAETSIFKSKTRFIHSEDKVVADKSAGTEAMLTKLKEMKQSLEEELRCKMAAFKIDDQCKRLPQHMTPSTAQKDRKAVDYEKLLVRSMTAPTLAVDPKTGRGGGKSSPSSPGSPSSPLAAFGKSKPTSPKADSLSSAALKLSKPGSPLKAAAASMTK